MGILVPEDFPMSELKNDEERRVVEGFCDRLSDGWLVIPDDGIAVHAITRPTSCSPTRIWWRVAQHVGDRGHPPPPARRAELARRRSGIGSGVARGCRDYAFVRWEGREGRAIVCENIHRTKGLEFDHVIVVADDGVSDDLLYVGVSRAVMSLTVVAHPTVLARLA